MNIVLITISSLLFIIYGLLCINTDHMVAEFERYGVSKYRTLVGYLELLGGLGQLLGYFYLEQLFIFSTTGLVVLMSMAVTLRWRLKDPYIQIIPAAGLLVINAILLYDCVKSFY